ncbi:MAG TPA: hypothetical protein VF759_07465 [Allosphingosinicella sp.]|jgi:hypothetical protein
MRKLAFRMAALGLAVAAGMAPGIATAQQVGYYYFNDGNGNCGYISCGDYGCVVVDRFPCPREVGDD